MSNVSLNVKLTLKAIKRFKFEELESAVFPIFPELSWDRIKLKLIKNHKSLTTDQTLPIIQEEIIKEKIAEKSLQNRLSALEVIDVSRHFKKKTWYAHEFKGTSELDFPMPQEIERHIKQSCDVYHMEVDVRATMYNGMIFVSIKDRPKKQQRKTIMPAYFSFVMNEKFFFTSKKTVLKNTLMAIATAMGYNSVKQIKLSGRDVHSLVQMLLTKKNAALQGESAIAPLPFKETPPSATALGLDFTQHKQREDYANKCFGDKPPTFEVLKVKSYDQKWKHEDALEKIPDQLIFTAIEFRSPNVPNFLKLLIKDGIMKTPLPPYAANVLTLGRNELTMQERPT